MQFITHYTERYSYLDAARMALEGGCRWVQLRLKDLPNYILMELWMIWNMVPYLWYRLVVVRFDLK